MDARKTLSWIGDVTLGHYVAKSEAQLRGGWQAVADFVEKAAGEGVTQMAQFVDCGPSASDRLA